MRSADALNFVVIVGDEPQDGEDAQIHGARDVRFLK